MTKAHEFSQHELASVWADRYTAQVARFGQADVTVQCRACGATWSTPVGSHGRLLSSPSVQRHRAHGSGIRLLERPLPLERSTP